MYKYVYNGKFQKFNFDLVNILSEMIFIFVFFKTQFQCLL